MIEGRPSRTALRVAAFRAAHQLLDSPKVLDDPLAVVILQPEYSSAIQRTTRWPASKLSSSPRAFFAVRSRFAEDQLALAIQRGATQYVILGAGLDTFAYRNPHQNLRVFEVDFPATQAWKRRRLEKTGIAIPSSLTFVPVDFEKQSFVDCLTAAGFLPQQHTFFSWLGVTYYLAPATVFSTFESIRALSPQNGVVFDYSVPRASLDFLNRLAHDRVTRRVARAGEPMQSFFDPADLASRLTAMGYTHIEDLDTPAINARYFAHRADSLRTRGRLGRLLCAHG
jgi:methyltransferase (TIGR00027 family)